MCRQNKNEIASRFSRVSVWVAGQNKVQKIWENKQIGHVLFNLILKYVVVKSAPGRIVNPNSGALWRNTNDNVLDRLVSLILVVLGHQFIF